MVCTSEETNFLRGWEVWVARTPNIKKTESQEDRVSRRPSLIGLPITFTSTCNLVYFLLEFLKHWTNFLHSVFLQFVIFPTPTITCSLFITKSFCNLIFPWLGFPTPIFLKIFHQSATFFHMSSSSRFVWAVFFHVLRFVYVSRERVSKYFVGLNPFPAAVNVTLHLFFSHFRTVRAQTFDERRQERHVLKPNEQSVGKKVLEMDWNGAKCTPLREREMLLMFPRTQRSRFFYWRCFWI